MKSKLSALLINRLLMISPEAKHEIPGLKSTVNFRALWMPTKDATCLQIKRYAAMLVLTFTGATYRLYAGYSLKLRQNSHPQTANN